MQIKIDPVKSSEVQLLSLLSKRCFYDTFVGQNSAEDMTIFLEKNFNENVLQQEMEDLNNYFFFCRLSDEIVGYIKLSDAQQAAELVNLNSIEIARIYAIKEKIGLGIGKSMMDFAISFARQHNKKTIWLGVWEHNKRAIDFYKKYGFTKFSQHVFMVGNDAQTDWLMQKELT